jgi:DNA-binding GntR family transcriptional regulator
VSFYPRRGAAVSIPSLAESKELFDIRALIEPDVPRRTIPWLTEDNFRRAEDLVDTAQA